MHQLRYYVEKPSSPLLVRITVHSHNIVVVVSCGQQIGARALYLVILTNSSHGRNCARVVYVDVNQISRLQWLRHESLKLARCRRIWAVAERKRAMVAQTYCVTRRGCSQRLVVAHGLWQSKHLLVGRWCLSARKTSVWGLPQLVGIRALVVDLAVVAHVASNVPDAPLSSLIMFGGRWWWCKWASRPWTLRCRSRLMRKKSRVRENVATTPLATSHMLKKSEPLPLLFAFPFDGLSMQMNSQQVAPISKLLQSCGGWQSTVLQRYSGIQDLK